MADRSASQIPKAVTIEETVTTAPIIRASGVRSPTSLPTPGSASLAADLSAAQSARGSLQNQLHKLEAAHSKTTAELRNLRSSHANLNNQHVILQKRFRDRDTELRGKTKLLENIQDELATTEIELTVQNREMEKLRRENQTLVDRWMKKMAGEAEKMNIALEGDEKTARKSKRTESEEAE